MKKIQFITCSLILGLVALFPLHANARVFVGIGFGGCCYGGGWGYPYYYAPYYALPVVYAAQQPPVVYMVPQPPVVYYQSPAPVVYGDPVALQANQTSPTFIDRFGRTCRQFQGTSAYASGTACLQPDGTWRITQ